MHVRGAAFEEDKVIIEAQQRIIDADASARTIHAWVMRRRACAALWTGWSAKIPPDHPGQSGLRAREPYACDQPAARAGEKVESPAMQPGRAVDDGEPQA